MKQKKIFVSYCHKQADWVQNWLLPVLDGSHHEVLIDRRRFKADEQLHDQMDQLQDEADHQILILSPDYLASKNCKHEMHRIGTQRPIAIKMVACKLPKILGNPLWLDFSGPQDTWPDQWEVFARTFELDWDVTIPAWFEARHKVVRHLERNDSVNLISQAKGKNALLKSLLKVPGLNLNMVDFQAGEMTTREGLVEALLKAAGVSPSKRITNKNALVVLAKSLRAQSILQRQVWVHFQWALEKAGSRSAEYNADFFSSIRNLAVEPEKRLALLMFSEQAVEEWMQRTYGLSPADFKSVWLK